MIPEEKTKKPKIIFETVVSYEGVKFNTLLKITAKEIIFKKKKMFSNKYRTVERVLINDILVKNDRARIILDRNDIIIITKDDQIEFSAEDKQEARKIVEIVFSLRTGRKYTENKYKKRRTMLKALRNTVAIGGAIAITAGIYKLIKENKNDKSK